MRFVWVILIALVGCSTAGRDALRAYREAFATGDYVKAQELLAKAELEKEPQSRLLLLMERGRLKYASGDFKSAAADFTAAIELTDAQYTKSITREGSKWLLNDASGEFFGAAYERSWLYYHQALAHWRLYQEGKLPPDQARLHLFSARAALLAWDSFFQEWQRATGGKTLYRHDLAAKMIAGEVHEATGLRADLQIALQLYKDGWKILNTINYSYPAFNKDAGEFAGALEKALHDDGEFKLPSKNREATTIANSTRSLILHKIVSLTQSLRPSELSQLPKQLGVTAEEIKNANKKNGNVVFVLEEGVMPPKIAEEINLGVQGVAKLAKDKKTQEQIARVGSEIMATFAVGVLGLTPSTPGQAASYPGTHALMTLAAHEAAIAFEVPAIEKGPGPQEMWVIVRDAKGAEVARGQWNVITHLEDIARQSLDEESGQRIVRTGVRVVMKHVTAILAAMAIYKNLSKGEKDNLLAKYAAIGSYVAATKGIAYSERADTRAWLTLPRTMRMSEMSLAPGSYTAELAKITEQTNPVKVRDLGPLTVTKDRAIFTYLIPQL